MAKKIVVENGVVVGSAKIDFGKANIVELTGKGEDYILETGSGADKITAKKGSIYNEIHSGDAADKITIEVNAVVKGVDAGSGNNSVTVNGAVKGNVVAANGKNSITIGKTGAVDGNIAAGVGTSTVNVNGKVKNIIVEGTEKDKSKITVGKGATAENISVAGANAATVTVNGNAANVLTGDGSDKITVAKDVSVGDINAGKGKNIITVNGASGNITTGNDYDKITLNWDSYKQGIVINSGAGNDVIAIKGKNAKVSSFKFDYNDKNLVMTDAQGKTITITDWKSGNLKAITFADGKKDASYIDTKVTLDSGLASATDGKDTISVTDKSLKIGKNSFVPKENVKVTIDAKDGADTIKVAGAHDYTVNAGAGADKITVTAGSKHVINGDGGADVIKVSGGSEITVNGGGDADNISVSKGTGIVVNGDSGADTINVSGGAGISVNGGADRDVINLTGGRQIIVNGGAGDDVINITWNKAKDITVNGNEGKDSIVVKNLKSKDVKFAYANGDKSTVLMTDAKGTNTVALNNFSASIANVTFADKKSLTAAEILKSLEPDKPVDPVKPEITFFDPKEKGYEIVELEDSDDWDSRKTYEGTSAKEAFKIVPDKAYDDFCGVIINNFGDEDCLDFSEYKELILNGTRRKIEFTVTEFNGMIIHADYHNHGGEVGEDIPCACLGDIKLNDFFKDTDVRKLQLTHEIWMVFNAGYKGSVDAKASGNNIAFAYPRIQTDPLKATITNYNNNTLIYVGELYDDVGNNKFAHKREENDLVVTFGGERWDENTDKSYWQEDCLTFKDYYSLDVKPMLDLDDVGPVALYVGKDNATVDLSNGYINSGAHGYAYWGGNGNNNITASRGSHLIDVGSGDDTITIDGVYEKAADGGRLNINTGDGLNKVDVKNAYDVVVKAGKDKDIINVHLGC